MKIVIDIPEEAKQAFDRAESNDLKGGYYDHGGIIGKAIKNGTPTIIEAEGHVSIGKHLKNSIPLSKGHWITKPHVYGVKYCSECDFELKIDDTKYCPNCGLKMEAESEE